jgi:uncharacterized protein
MRVIADSGFLVGRWSQTDSYRNWAMEWLRKATLPLLTSAANVQEAEWLLENHEIVFRMVQDGDVLLALDYQKEADALHALLKKYSPRMDLADASIVRLSELYPQHLVLTVDRSDFKVYRRFGKEVIPCDFPPQRGWLERTHAKINLRCGDSA